MTSVNDGGTPIGLAISSRAPPDEMFRTVQSTPPPPPKASVPCFSTLCLGATLFSTMSASRIPPRLRLRLQKRNYGQLNRIPPVFESTFRFRLRQMPSKRAGADFR